MSQSKPSGLSAALGHEQFGLELTAERLGPNGVSICSDPALENTSLVFANRSTKEAEGRAVREGSVEVVTSRIRIKIVEGIEAYLARNGAQHGNELLGSLRIP